MLRKNEQNYVMGLQHCIGGDEEFQTHFLKFPEYFAADCNINKNVSGIFNQ